MNTGLNRAEFYFFTFKIGLETGSLGLIQYGWDHTIIPNWISSFWIPLSSMCGFHPHLQEFNLRAGIPTIICTFQARSEEWGQKGDLTFQEVFPEISCNTFVISVARTSFPWGRLGNVVFWSGCLAITNKIKVLLLVRKGFYKVNNFFLNFSLEVHSFSLISSGTTFLPHPSQGFQFP